LKYILITWKGYKSVQATGRWCADSELVQYCKQIITSQRKYDNLNLPNLTWHNITYLPWLNLIFF
jgi:hypothetical protein